jgi:hypothetical protein
MMLDLLAQNLDFCVIKLVADAHGFDLGNQLLGRRMFDRRFVEQVVIPGDFACRRIE